MSEQFDLMGRSYEEALRSYPEFRREELDYILRRLDLRAGMSVLDFTAGSGFVTLPLLDLVGQHGQVVAVDSSAVMLGQLVAKLPPGSPAKCVWTSDPSLADVGDEVFDRVVSLGGFHHVADQVRVCGELYRRLRPGGRALILDFADGSLSQEHFDGLVHDHNPDGHHALFLSPSRAVNLARFTGCPAAEVEVVRFKWVFPSIAAAGDFFVRLHGLRCSATEAAGRVAGTFSRTPDEAGPVALPFDYVSLELRKPA